ncbi:hypothetical protein EC915_1037 [Pseudomonas sp. LP_7_YM]|nr:hypothetical protein EC915_1037 [Pseudomonas sp. LP_7_YM]
MFGSRLTDIEPIKEAVATYTQRAAEKLRAQKSLCKKICGCIRTGISNLDEAKYTTRPDPKTQLTAWTQMNGMRKGITTEWSKTQAEGYQRAGTSLRVWKIRKICKRPDLNR